MRVSNSGLPDFRIRALNHCIVRGGAPQAVGPPDLGSNTLGSLRLQFQFCPSAAGSVWAHHVTSVGVTLKTAMRRSLDWPSTSILQDGGPGRCVAESWALDPVPAYKPWPTFWVSSFSLPHPSWDVVFLLL